MRSLTILLALAACSKPAADSPDVRASQGSSLVGLYERSGIPDEPSRICVTANGTEHRFGLKSSYEGPESCMAKGSVRQAGSELTLSIDGDPACSFSATVTETGLTLREPRGPECSYYCGTNTGLDGGPFEKVGATEADARKATDIAGEPLC